MRRLRIVAIELGMCRSGRIGGASGSSPCENPLRHRQHVIFDLMCCWSSNHDP